jgi:anti-sigma B factor antagonist
MANIGLTLTSRVVGDVAVLYCKGRVVAGDEAQELQKKVKSLLVQCCDVVLNFSEITYIDSSGIGALVTVCTRGSAPNGQVVLSDLPERVRELLTITKLVTVFEIYDTEAAAIYALYGEVARAGRPGAPTGARLLCVDSSNDLLSYLREILYAANYQVLTTLNLSDALLLVRATRFSLLVLGPNFVRTGSSGVEALRAAAGDTPTITFHDNEDAAEMARDVLSKIEKALPSKQAARPN